MKKIKEANLKGEFVEFLTDSGTVLANPLHLIVGESVHSNKTRVIHDPTLGAGVSNIYETALKAEKVEQVKKEAIHERAKRSAKSITQAFKKG